MIGPDTSELNVHTIIAATIPAVSSSPAHTPELSSVDHHSRRRRDDPIIIYPIWIVITQASTLAS
jgi:hypothetical protein